ncbi:Hypothetical predicted protein [Olea europaea subsp. europaea]|uniref:Uncharacterized protein n=1 Tax=Olea europaea subsp. europaea TaxID=158383 RepID=A0A8S0QD80_OLEEU|nr:Hypothetical predicted protein [Olea europaea subsp. europaea]
MAGAGYWISPRNINRNVHVHSFEAKTRDHAKKNELPLMKTGKKSSKTQQSLIRISASEGRWDGQWNSHYNLSWKQLQLQDLLLMEEYNHNSHRNTPVSITLCIQKHTGFGLSVEGRIMTCFTTKCCNCCSPFLRQIDSTFKAWVLPSRSSRQKYSSDQQLPEIGVDDPSVIYVKPGCEADLDSLVQDTIRLAISVKETCSDSCDKSEPKLLHLGARNAGSMDRRWYRLLELKNAKA